jgi:hypothetical protein
MDYWEIKNERTTAVLRYCEISGKFTFIFRKKYYLSGNKFVPKLATVAKPQDVGRHIGRKTAENSFSIV